MLEQYARSSAGAIVSKSTGEVFKANGIVLERSTSEVLGTKGCIKESDRSEGLDVSDYDFRSVRNGV